MSCDREKLAAAEAAYHDLMTGRMARVIVDSNGERVEFTSASAGRLWAYIESLRAQCRAAGNPNTPKGPFRFIF